MSEDVNWIDRDRGILTKRDREILTGEYSEDLSQNALTQRRYNIRNRIENAIYDFYILARNLPLNDIHQTFEPAYEWSRERRYLNEEGRTAINPDLTPLLRSWMALFEFYTYGMYASEMQETQSLMCGLIQEGVERGFRQYQHENSPTYREVAATLTIEYDNQVLRDNYFRQIWRDLPDKPDELAERIMKLHQERKIPYNVANQWIEETVRNPQTD